MKPKKRNRKLSINKNTVAHLNIKGMQNVQGGWEFTDIPVTTCKSDSCEPGFCQTCSCRPPCYIP